MSVTHACLRNGLHVIAVVTQQRDISVADAGDGTIVSKREEGERQVRREEERRRGREIGMMHAKACVPPLLSLKSVLAKLDVCLWKCVGHTPPADCLRE